MTDYPDTSRFIELTRQRQAPWQEPQNPGSRFLPYNPISDQPFKGINSLILAAEAKQRGFNDLRWLTRGQAERLGAAVRSGEQPTRIAFWSLSTKTEDGTSVPLNRPQVTLASVWNGEQIDGIESAPERIIRPMAERVATMRVILQTSQATIDREVGRYVPRYDRATDRIILPDQQPFDNPAYQQQDAIRQLAAWTGHPTRLDRPVGPPGSTEYAREELRCGLATMFLGDRLEIGYAPRLEDTLTEQWVDLISKDQGELLRDALMAEVIARDILDYSRPLTHQLDQQQMQALAQRVAVDLTREAEDRRHLETIIAHREPMVPDPRESFGDVLRQAGFVLEGLPIADGTLHRVPVEGDRGRQTSGAYTLHVDGVPAGYFQNFRSGEGKQTWKAERVYAKLTASQRADLKREAQERLEARAREIEATRTQAAQKVLEVWRGSVPAADHPYLHAKGVLPHGERIGVAGQTMPVRGRDGAIHQTSLEGKLLIPLWNERRQLCTLQVISAAPDADGRWQKGFWPGGQVAGAFRVIGPLDTDKPIHTVEGNATGATIHEATGNTVFVAFTVNNLEAVAHIAKALKPDNEHWITADNDHSKAQERMPNGQPKGNPGLERATHVARLLDAGLLAPRFTKEDRGLSDWNDLSKKLNHNMDDVRRQIHQAMTIDRTTRRSLGIAKERDRQDQQHQRDRQRVVALTR